MREYALGAICIEETKDRFERGLKYSVSATVSRVLHGCVRGGGLPWYGRLWRRFQYLRDAQCAYVEFGEFPVWVPFAPTGTRDIDGNEEIKAEVRWKMRVVFR